jgi:hypothetical protein
VPYLSAGGKELYVMVDAPPQPPPSGAAAGAPAAAAGAPQAVRKVAESTQVPAGTVIVVRLATDVSSATAKVGDRFQGFLDQDLAANGLVTTKGSRVYGVVSLGRQGRQDEGQPALSVTLTDVEVGGQVVSVKTQPVTAAGEAGKGGRKIVAGAALGAGIGAIADGGEGAAVGAAIGAGVGTVGAAAGSAKAAVIPAQSAQAFTLAAPLQVEVMTSVAVR